jgi:hypothetical protein
MITIHAQLRGRRSALEDLQHSSPAGLMRSERRSRALLLGGEVGRRSARPQSATPASGLGTAQ